MEDFRYNSAVYTSLGANEFYVVLVTSDHFEPGAYANTSWLGHTGQLWQSRNTTTGKQYGDIGYQTDSHDIQLFNNMLEGHNTDPQSYEDLTLSQCINRYNTDFVPDHRNLFLITNYTSNAKYNDTLLSVGVVFPVLGPSPPSRWMCSYYLQNSIRCDFNVLTTRVAGGHPWMVDAGRGEGAEISRCKSEKVAERCSVKFLPGIMMAVICCNLVKACCMIMAVVRSREPTLVTLGDAIDSF